VHACRSDTNTPSEIILPLQSELRYKVNYYVVSLCAMALQMKYCRVSLCAMTVQYTSTRCQPVCNDLEMSCFMQNATFASLLASCCLSVVVCPWLSFYMVRLFDCLRICLFTSVCVSVAQSMQQTHQHMTCRTMQSQSRSPWIFFSPVSARF